MKIFRRLTALGCALVLLCALVIPAAGGSARAAGQERTLTILFTHDTHDHFVPDAADRGGYTRLATLLNQERAAAEGAVITVDGGDFSMGSLFQTVYATDAPELRALGAMGYDVTTFGNHEYDYRPQGLASMLDAARTSGEPLPAIVQANYKTPKDPSAQVAVDAMDRFPVTDYVMLERDGLRIAVFGVMGVDSDECAPMSGMVLEPLVDAAKRVVADIKAKESPDYIICLSHAGTDDGKGEDYELAQQVDGIDVIISGHTHTTLDAPIAVNDTLIVSCGAYTRNLGRLVVTKSGSAVAMKGYTLFPLDSSIPSDPEMEALVERFKEKVDETYLCNYGMEYNEILASVSSTFTTAQTGDYIGRAYIETLKELEGDAYVPVAFAVAPDGVIRGRLQEGTVNTSQAFDILSLGVGEDGSPGYPLLSLYLTGADLKNTFEVDASVSVIMPAATLYGAGAQWTYNPNRMFLDRVTASGLQDGTAIQDDRLYRVVADFYSGQMLATVKSKSFGLLSITPRDAQGNEISDFADCIVHDSQGNEVKAWYALASQLRRDGQVDKGQAAVSKRVVSSWSPVDLLIPMGMPTLVVTLAALLVLAVLVLIIVLIVRAVKRKKSGKGKTAKKKKKK